MNAASSAQRGCRSGPHGTGRQRTAVAVVYVAAMCMAIMDTTIVNVALPTIGWATESAGGGRCSVPSAYSPSVRRCADCPPPWTS